jgi:nucleotide-binding universal stress UspA family protein
MTYKRILVPVDGSPTSNVGLAEAVKLARSVGAAVRLLHVINEFALFSTPEAGINLPEIIEAMKRAGEKLLDKAMKTATAQQVQAQAVLVESAGERVADIIEAKARRYRADLIVMGTQGRRGIARIVMGSDAEHVVQQATMPVLLVPPGSSARRRAVAAS